MPVIPTALGHQMNYVALSHCWGDQTDIAPIVCNGDKLEVASNLNEALALIRNDSDYRPSYIWADALCINQEDVDERSSQVTLMG
jgi:hypothetical protein